MSKTRVRVTICGAEYSFVTDDSPEYVIQIAEQVDQQVSTLLKQNPWISLNTAAIYAAVDARDCARQDKSAAEHLRAQMKEYLADSARCQSEAEEARRSLEKMQIDLDKSKEEAIELYLQMEAQQKELEALREEMAALREELQQKDERLVLMASTGSRSSGGAHGASELEDQTRIELPSGKLHTGGPRPKGISPDEFINMIDNLSGKKD